MTKEGHNAAKFNRSVDWVLSLRMVQAWEGGKPLRNMGAPSTPASKWVAACEWRVLHPHSLPQHSRSLTSIEEYGKCLGWPKMTISDVLAQITTNEYRENNLLSA